MTPAAGGKIHALEPVVTGYIFDLSRPALFWSATAAKRGVVLRNVPGGALDVTEHAMRELETIVD